MRWIALLLATLASNLVKSQNEADLAACVACRTAAEFLEQVLDDPERSEKVT